MRLIRVTGTALIVTAALAAPALGGVDIADLSVTKVDSPDPVAAGTNITYTITALNAGPQDADFVGVLDAIPAATTFVSATAPAGWNVTTPPVGGTGNVFMSIPTLTVAAGAQVFTLVVQIDAVMPNGTVITNNVNVTSETFDDDQTNNAATATTTVGVPPPTPAASLADAATQQPGSGNPLAILGFAMLLVATLSASAVMAVRRVRS